MKTAVKSAPGRSRRTQSSREITREALTEFTVVQGAKLKRYLARRYGNELAEDAFQDALLETLKYQPISAIETGSIDRYIWKVALRCASKLEVKHRRELEKADGSSLSEISDLSGREVASSEANQNFARIGEALEQLSAVKRRAFVLNSTSDKSIGDIADELNITYSNARYHITDATKKVMSRVYGDRLSDICKSFEDEIYDSVNGELSLRSTQRLQRHLTHCGSCRKIRREMLHTRKSLAALVPVFLFDDRAFADLFDKPDTANDVAGKSLWPRGKLFIKAGVGATVSATALLVLLVAFTGGIEMTGTTSSNSAAPDGGGPSVSRSQTVALAFDEGTGHRKWHGKQAGKPGGTINPEQRSSSGGTQGGRNSVPRGSTDTGSTNGKGGGGSRPTGTSAGSGAQVGPGPKANGAPGQPASGGGSIASPDKIAGTHLSQPPQIAEAEEPIMSDGGPTISPQPQIKLPCNPKKFVC